MKAKRRIPPLPCDGGLPSLYPPGWKFRWVEEKEEKKKLFGGA